MKMAPTAKKEGVCWGLGGTQLAGLGSLQWTNRKDSGWAKTWVSAPELLCPFQPGCTPAPPKAEAKAKKAVLKGVHSHTKKGDLHVTHLPEA